ncbi:MAG: HAD family phosphatase [Lachnospiraceae bacterium]|nr:HAD family phosphatase [Lachnospiraceae bacterium]
MTCKGAIFDMDGLLFDTERIYQETWHELADKYHVKLADGFTKAISGTSGAHMCAVIEKYYHVSDGAPIMNECMECIRKKLETEVPLKAGVHELLQYFHREGVRMAVASSSAIQQIQANLKKSNIIDYFDEIVSGQEVRQGKPAPDIFLYAAEKIGCKPEECYVFEDSENGIRAGHAAGCVTVMIPDLIEPVPEIVPLCNNIYKSLLQVKTDLEQGVLG